MNGFFREGIVSLCHTIMKESSCFFASLVKFISWFNWMFVVACIIILCEVFLRAPVSRRCECLSTLPTYGVPNSMKYV